MGIEDKLYKKPAETNEAILNNLLGELEKLSPELAKQHGALIDKGLDEADDSEIYLGSYIKKVQAIIKFRKKEVARIIHSFVDSDKGFDEIEKTLFSAIDTARAQKESSFINRGSTAAVFEFPENTEVCAKIIDDLALYNEGNSIQIEADFLERLADHEVANVCTPKPLYIIEYTDKIILIMERLDGCSFQQLIDTKNPFPEKFDFDGYFENLKEYLVSLHNNGIIHGDIALRNFLIDNKTGDPMVVDFGRSVSLSQLEKESIVSDPKEKFDKLAIQEMKNLDSVANEASRLLSDARR